MRNPIFTSIGILSAATALVCSAASTWETEWEQAMEKAKKSGQPVLVDFTGSDWCPGCIYLRKRIFDTEPFAKYEAEHQFILLELDFPKKPGKISMEKLKFHEKLMHHYAISSFPTVLLMDGNGAPYAKMLSASKTPEEYLKRLDAARETRTKFKEAVAAATSLQGNAKLEQLVKALRILPEELQSHHKDLIAEIASLDPQDKYGFNKRAKVAAELEKQRNMYEQFCQKYAGKISPADVQASRAEAMQMLEKGNLLPSIRLEVAKFISDGYALERNLPKALGYLEIARDSDPESKAAKRLQPWIDNMKNIIQQEQK